VTHVTAGIVISDSIAWSHARHKARASNSRRLRDARYAAGPYWPTQYAMQKWYQRKSGVGLKLNSRRGCRSGRTVSIP
jgi:hypothetical protein